ncbi:MAG TPA: 3-phosphoshikimate 1-carboxyvinyltransferase [Thermoanaerobaculia bacterium]|nr:3-phosphoshikimate 1-carboxyvinyltransferase [Thermoanaerobaculia bacterium]
MKTIPKIPPARGTIRVPPSKSATARALLLAAMSSGQTTIRNPLDSDDTRYMLEAIRRIGFEVSGTFATALTIGERVSMSANDVEIDVGMAGTAMRFLTGFLSFTPGRYVLKGDERMHERPIGDLVDALRTCSAEIEYLGQEGFPPLQIRGKIVRGGFETSVDASTSSQFVSSVMMAATRLPGGITIRVESPVSQPYLDLTAAMLVSFGAHVEQLEAGGVRVSAGAMNLEEFVVEGDYSSASYWLAAAAASEGEVILEGLSPASVQGDAAFIDLLVQLGCSASWETERLYFRGAKKLGGGKFDMNRMPDVVPTLAAIAPLASAPIEISNVANLKVKESNRLEAIASELAKLGARCETREDGLLIHPGWSDSAASIDPHGDHRIAMGFAIAGLARGNVSIEDERVVSKSYPRFWRTLDELVESSGHAAESPQPAPPAI